MHKKESLRNILEQANLVPGLLSRNYFYEFYKIIKKIKKKVLTNDIVYNKMLITTDKNT